MSPTFKRARCVYVFVCRNSYALESPYYNENVKCLLKETVCVPKLSLTWIFIKFSHKQTCLHTLVPLRMFSETKCVFLALCFLNIMFLYWMANELMQRKSIRRICMGVCVCVSKWKKVMCLMMSRDWNFKRNK